MKYKGKIGYNLITKDTRAEMISYKCFKQELFIGLLLNERVQALSDSWLLCSHYLRKLLQERGGHLLTTEEMLAVVCRSPDDPLLKTFAAQLKAGRYGYDAANEPFVKDLDTWWRENHLQRDPANTSVLLTGQSGFELQFPGKKEHRMITITPTADKGGCVQIAATGLSIAVLNRK